MIIDACPDMVSLTYTSYARGTYSLFHNYNTGCNSSLAHIIIMYDRKYDVYVCVCVCMCIRVHCKSLGGQIPPFVSAIILVLPIWYIK